MRNDRMNYVLVGVFVLVVLAGLIFAIAALTGRTGATDTYYTTFDDVTGVDFGTQILYQGFPVGQVESVEPSTDPGGKRFRLELSVRRGWPIDREARASITQAGFLSAMVLSIKGGGDAGQLAPGDEIRSLEQGDVFAAITGVAGELTAIMQDVVRPLLDQVAERVPAVLDDAATLTAQLNASSERVNAILDEANVERIGSILRNAETVSQDLAVLTADLAETRAKLDRAMDTVNRVIVENEDEIDQAVQDLQYSLESVARRIDVFMANLESTSRNMNEFSREIRGNPSLLLRGTAQPDEGPDAP